MNQFGNKEIVQAVIIADNNAETLRPLSDANSTALLPLVNVVMLDYALEALNRSGIEEVFIYASIHLQNIRDHIKLGIASLNSWSINMKVHVIGGEGCRCFGDAMRDLDAKALIRGNFILLGANTVMNADLRPILEQHKKTVKYDKGAAATLIFKEATNDIRTGNEIMIAMDTQNKRLHHHQRLQLHHKESHFEVPLEVFINNSQMALMHNVLDPQIAIGSPSMLSLFSDNFDFQSRDDFVRGILINEEILDSRIYVALLPRQQYARKVNNWLTYQIVSQDIINRWVYPLVPDMGIHCLEQQYLYLKNNIYKSPKASVTKVALRENVVVHAGSKVEPIGSSVSCSVIGRNCKIGKNCHLSYAYIMDNVTIEDDCYLEYCVIGRNSLVGAKSKITAGTIIGEECTIAGGSKLEKAQIKASHGGDDEDDEVTKLNEHAYLIHEHQQQQIYAQQIKGVPKISAPEESDDNIDDVIPYQPKMQQLPLSCEESDYASSSEEEESHEDMTPLPDDTNIFLSEVMDSLARGFQEKSNPDFLVLEINSSRYAYNMSLKEVNYYVVKALFSLEHIKEPKNNNILVAVNSLLKHLGPILTNYIKTEDAMLECLKALGDVCEENALLKDKLSQVVHYLYDKDYVTDDAILAWFDQLDAEDEREEQLRRNLAKLIEWLNQSSDEDDDD